MKYIYIGFNAGVAAMWAATVSLHPFDQSGTILCTVLAFGAAGTAMHLLRKQT